MSLHVTITKGHEGSYSITLEGRLDTNTYVDLEERMGPVLTSSPKLLVFDLEKLDYISSMGIRSIVRARKAVKSKDGHVVLVNLQPQIQGVFDIVCALPQEAILSSKQEADRYFDMVQKKENEKPKSSS